MDHGCAETPPGWWPSQGRKFSPRKTPEGGHLVCPVLCFFRRVASRLPFEDPREGNWLSLFLGSQQGQGQIWALGSAPELSWDVSPEQWEGGGPLEERLTRTLRGSLHWALVGAGCRPASSGMSVPPAP